MGGETKTLQELSADAWLLTLNSGAQCKWSMVVATPLPYVRARKFDMYDRHDQDVLDKGCMDTPDSVYLTFHTLKQGGRYTFLLWHSVPFYSFLVLLQILLPWQVSWWAMSKEASPCRHYFSPRINLALRRHVCEQCRMALLVSVTTHGFCR